MIIYVDGSGNGKYGYVAMSNDGLETIDCKVFDSGDLKITNNQVEYLAILEALRVFPTEDVQIISDSQLVVNQLNHEWNINSNMLRLLALDVWNLCKNRKVEFKWIPREKNLAGKMLG